MDIIKQAEEIAEKEWKRITYLSCANLFSDLLWDISERIVGAEGEDIPDWLREDTDNG